MKETVQETRKKKLRKRILEHLLGPFGSVLFHILLVILAIKFLGMVTEERTSEIQVKIVEADAIDLEEFEKELEELQELQDLPEMITPPDQIVDTTAPPDVTEVAPSEDITMDLSDLSVLSDAQSPLVMRGLFEGRSASGRARMLGAAGKWAEATERSVIRALEWLKNNQEQDGSWPGGEQERSAMTGLALLTFLAHGETPTSERYGATVEKAIKALVRMLEGNAGNRFAPWNPGGEGGNHAAYAHGIATYALCEAYGLTRIPSLKGPMESALQLIIDGQQPGGSWNYGYRKDGRRDASVAGWQVQALKAGLIAGASNPGLKDTITRAVEEFKQSQNRETGMFPYSDGGGKMSITGVGVLCLQIAGYGRDNSVKDGLKALRDAEIKWQDPMEWPMYSWYYITQAKFHAGGGDWDGWNRMFAPELIRNQNEDGSWTSAGQNIEGDGHGKEVNYGPVYSTTLAALTLQVYYRFLPTYKPIEPMDMDTTSDDVVIEIM